MRPSGTGGADKITRHDPNSHRHNHFVHSVWRCSTSVLPPDVKVAVVGGNVFSLIICILLYVAWGGGGRDRQIDRQTGRQADRHREGGWVVVLCTMRLCCAMTNRHACMRTCHRSSFGLCTLGTILLPTRHHPSVFW